ncbi:iron-siderophore ABC transporter substrate-binding protein [Brevibacillus invocatus]|uniref:Iron-siderophore ABC transporter substrate-binding protein n=2 Tax=Brevibacillus TaxID=55080 RepID=A0A3M8BVM3_9BACL|nr:iron-siderophore ABC transporter substrate-binding protein [Brevibacillus invocatus]RNB67491.1 iron-siderophore ABC transporter substrate-binding protein [Brevibacillus invocatus]
MKLVRKPAFQLASAIGLSLMLLVTGCGGASQSSSSSQPAATPATSAPAAEASAAPETKSEARTIKHAMGETPITGTPTRVVILTNEGTEALLSLGIKPVGAVKSWQGEPWYEHIKDQMQDVTVLGEETQPNLELIASLKPDLILGNKVRQEKVYSQLSAIAPTVFSEELSGNWKTNFKLYAEAVNKQAEGDALLADFDKRVEEAKTKLGEKTKTQVSLVRFLNGKVRVYMKDTFAGVLFNQLGFARPAAQDKDEFMQVIAKEQMAVADGDVLFYWVSDYDDKDAAKYKDEWINDPLWKNLNAAKTNQVFQVNEVIWNTSGGILAANMLVDEIVNHFSK